MGISVMVDKKEKEPVDEVAQVKIWREHIAREMKRFDPNHVTEFKMNPLKKPTWVSDKVGTCSGKYEVFDDSFLEKFDHSAQEPFKKFEYAQTSNQKQVCRGFTCGNNRFFCKFEG